MQALVGGTRQPDYDLVIVGAGMVGISLALMLARQGHNWRVLIVEARAADGDDSELNFDARSTALSSTTQKIFQQLGVWQGLQRHANALDCIDCGCDFTENPGSVARAGTDLENFFMSFKL